MNKGKLTMEKPKCSNVLKMKHTEVYFSFFLHLDSDNMKQTQLHPWLTDHWQLLFFSHCNLYRIMTFQLEVSFFLNQ